MDLRIEKILNKERKLQFWQIFAVAATLLEEFLAHWHFSSDFATVWCQFWDHHIQEEEANTDFNADFVTLGTSYSQINLINKKHSLENISVSVAEINSGNGNANNE